MCALLFNAFGVIGFKWESVPRVRLCAAPLGFGVQPLRGWVAKSAAVATRIAVAIVCLAVGTVSVSNASAEELRHFITRDGDRLMDGSQPFRFISFNVPNLLVVEDEFNFTRREPFRWPNEFEIEDALESIRQMGGRVVRTYVISVYRDGSEMGRTVHVLAPGEFNEEAFRTLDKVLEVAGRKGIRVIIPLVDQHKWFGGITQYAAFHSKPSEAFWSDPELIADFKKTIDFVINRKNELTGVAYREDKAIFGWETGNEIDSPAAWTREIARYIKQLDKNHLVIDGRSMHGVPEWSLEDENVDVVTTHHYPGATDDFVPAIRKAVGQTTGKRPYFVGEFGFVPTANIRAVLDTAIEEGVSGALLWSLRFHRREGGFYWHMEVGTGGNFYKAYHWPGFESGSDYDERRVLKLMRARAFAIRGLKPAPRDPPAAPTLLPIEGVSAISWQGSAGAASYDVERSTKADRGWITIGHNVSDAAVQYRPLFNDDQAVPGESYYYRVIARNEAGQSAPSNVVGPVAARCRTLVDECADLTLIQKTEGRVSVIGKNARIAQEDCHRFAMQPGAAVVYRVEGPIDALRIYTFARDTAVELQVHGASNGSSFEPLAARRSVFSSNEGDYGYLTPVLYEADGLARPVTRLKIVLPPDAVANSSKAEGAAPPVEISRIEIEYAWVGRQELRR